MGTSGGKTRLGAVLPALVVLAAAALLVVGIVGLGPTQVEPPDWSTGGQDEDEPFQQPTRPIMERPTAQPQGSGDGTDLPELSVPWEAAFAFLVAAVLVVGFLVLRRLRTAYGARGRSVVVGGHVDDVPDAADDLRQAVRSASDALAREETAGHEAVIKAWQALESAAAASGAPRRPSHTPSEFTAQLLRRHHADAAATTRLRDLYHHARFSPQPRMSTDDVRSAREALATILDTIEAPERAGPNRAEAP